MFEPRMYILATILLRDRGDHVLPDTSCLATSLQNIGFERNRRDFDYRHGGWCGYSGWLGLVSMLISYRLGVSYRGHVVLPAERSRTEVIGVEVLGCRLQPAIRLSVSSRALPRETLGYRFHFFNSGISGIFLLITKENQEHVFDDRHIIRYALLRVNKWCTTMMAGDLHFNTFHSKRATHIRFVHALSVRLAVSNLMAKIIPPKEP